MAGEWDASTDEIDVGTWDVGAIQAFTMFTWVYLDTTTVSDSRFLSKSVGTGTQDHDWMMGTVDSSGNKYRCRFKAGSNTGTFIGTSATNIGSWDFMIVTYDGTNVHMKVNDTTEFDTAHSPGGNMDTSTRQINIGNNEGDNKGPDGMLAEVGVLSEEITDERATALSKGVNILGVTKISEGYWPLWLNNTTTTPEFSSNGRTGTITSVTKRAPHPPVELMENYL